MSLDRTSYQRITPAFAAGEGGVIALTGTVAATGYTLRVDAATTQGGPPNLSGITAAVDGTTATKINVTVSAAATLAAKPSASAVAQTYGPTTTEIVYCTLWRTDVSPPVVLARFAFPVYDSEASE